MPELPEVETIKRELEEKLVAKKITDVIVNNPKVIREPQNKDFVNQLKGVTIRHILRKAKLLILELSNGKALTIHLKMTGQLIYPGTGKKSRVSFLLSDGKLLDFNDQRLFGELRVVDDWHKLRFIQSLGPELSTLSPKNFQKMLTGKNTRIKPLLMDQAFISGIGNLYAAESLFQARIRPDRAASNLSDKEKQALFFAIKRVLNEAIRCGGSSVDDYVRLSGKKGNYASKHKVYDRKGEPCLVCKTTIKRINLGGRGTYFCPKCQR
ncbi:bifunctional DNA-formamidopyrimidine glycosylase/DNA-(apurinic or apyrimidinic site) lyase [bacterium]|nr:MAG: bifunctional DNA-formamidopyrimidine glycosylase/DNA-(apurinic or apyrimidinic site) lyase [bacterium]